MLPHTPHGRAGGPVVPELTPRPSVLRGATP